MRQGNGGERGGRPGWEVKEGDAEEKERWAETSKGVARGKRTVTPQSESVPVTGVTALATRRSEVMISGA